MGDRDASGLAVGARRAIERRPDISSPLRFLWWLVRCQRWRVLRGALLGSSWMVTLAAPPYILSRAIDDGLARGDRSIVVAWSGALLLCGVVNALLSIARHRTMTRVRLDAHFRMQRLLVDHVTKLGADLPRLSTGGEVATIGIADVSAVSLALTVTGPGFGAVVTYIVVGTLLARSSIVFAVIVLVGVPLLGVSVGPLLRRLVGKQEAYRDGQGRVSSRLIDVVNGHRILDAFGGKSVYGSRFRADSAALLEDGYRLGAVTSWIEAVGVGLPSLFLAAVTWVGARLAVSGSITIGQLVAAYGYTAMLAVPVAMFIEGAGQLSRAFVAARRMTQLLAASRANVGGAAAPPATPSPLIDPESGIEIVPGTFTALATADRQNVIALIDRLGGLVVSDVRWGDQELSSIDVEALRERVLVADDGAFLFAGSLRSVVSGRTDADDPAILAALHVVVADDVVDLVPGGLDGAVRSDGSNLSGGQRQRLRLARAVLAKPDVLLTVEPTSALDATTEAMLADRLRDARAGKTTVVATTSPLLLAQADVVHHLVDGRVAVSGSHRKLLRQCADYRVLVTNGIDDDQISRSRAPRKPRRR